MCQLFAHRKDDRSPQDNESRLFETTLTDYIAALRLPVREAQHAQQVIAQHDFSSARCHLIPSVPGYHQGAVLAPCHCLLVPLLHPYSGNVWYRQERRLNSLHVYWHTSLWERVADYNCECPPKCCRPVDRAGEGIGWLVWQLL